MAIHYRTQGFVLKKTDRSESDQVFTIFTKDFGKIEVLGKGIRKIKSKLRPNIDIFSFCEIEFIQGRAGKTLTDVETINRFEKIKENLEKAKIAYKISGELDSAVIGQEKDEKIWELLKKFFTALNNYQFLKKQQENDKLKALYDYFVFNLLSILGYK